MALIVGRSYSDIRARLKWPSYRVIQDAPKGRSGEINS
jgi:hypothetical protein